MKIILALTLALSLNAHAQLTEKYAEGAKKKWETEIQKFEKLDKENEYPADSILFMGSSSIRLWYTLARDMAPFPVIQRGYGGAKFSDLAVFAKRIAHPHTFRAVAIFVANDIAGNKDDLTPDEVAALFKNVTETIRQKNADAPIFLIAITPTNSRWKSWPQIQKANAAMQAVCDADDKMYFIVTEPQFLNTEGKPKTELFRDDQLHLNADGYIFWTKIIRGKIESVLEKQP